MFLSTRRSLQILQTWGYIRFPSLSFFGNLKARVRSAPFTSYVGQGAQERNIFTVQQLKEAPADGQRVQMPPCDFVPKAYTGLPLERIKEIRRTRVHPAIKPLMRNAPLFWKGHKQWLWDENNKRYLDMFAGFVTIGCGHSHPKIVEAAKQQIDDLWHLTNVFYISIMHEYAEMLTSTLPGDLKVVYFVNSGSEANDLAMLMARLFTGSYDLISLKNGYHGMSPWCMGATSIGTWKHDITLGTTCHHAMNPNVYRGPWGGARCRDSVSQVQRDCNCKPGECHAAGKYAEQLEEVLSHSAGKRVAGFIAEAIQGAGGAVQLPNGYLAKAYKAVRERGGLCIADEVQTAFGRLGSHFWGFESQGVMPDIVTTAKTIGNGFPLAAVITTPEIAKSLTGALHFNTYGGNAIACAVGKAVLEVIKEEKLQENAAVVGTYLIEKLLTLKEEFPDVVGDVRGKGLMLGIELISNKEEKTPLDPEKFLDVWEDIKNMGVIIGRAGLHGNIFRIAPPLIITKDDADFTVDVIRRALVNLERR